MARYLLLLLLLPLVPANAQVCGDCDGDLSITILDALTSARIAGGLLAPSAAQLIACDVDATSTITVLDALRLAQTSAGLPVVLSCPNNAPTVMIVEPATGTIVQSGSCCRTYTTRISLDLADPDLDPVSLLIELTTDAGVTWDSINPTNCLPSPTWGVATPVTGMELWWVPPSPPGFMVGAELRVTADDGRGGVASSTVTGLTIQEYPPCPCVPPFAYVYLIDTSASMLTTQLVTPIPGNPTPTAWEYASYILQGTISGLSLSEEFGIVAAGDTATAWQPNLVPATPANIAAAMAWIASLSPSGGVNYVPAIDAAAPMGAMITTLFSTGYPNAGQAEVAAVRVARGGAPIEVIGLGATDIEPLRILCDLSTGLAQMVD